MMYFRVDRFFRVLLNWEKFKENRQKSKKKNKKSLRIFIFLKNIFLK